MIPYLINLAPETQNHSKITKKAHEGFWKTLRNKFILLKNYVMLQNLSTLMFTEVGIEILEMLEFSKFKNITFYFVKHVS